MLKKLRVLLVLFVSALGLAFVLSLQPTKEVVKRLPGYTDLRILVYNLKNGALDPSDAGNGGPATKARFVDPAGLAKDSSGNVYVSDRHGLIWKIDATGTARVIAGTGRRGRAEPGGIATETGLGAPQGLAVDSRDRLYFADSVNNLVLRISKDGILERVAGNGKIGYAGDSGPASSASLYSPFDIRFDSKDNLYIVDVGSNRIRKVDEEGMISTVAGNGGAGFSGDGGPATDAELNEPWGAYVDYRDRLFITDSGNHVIRMVDDQGDIHTFAGSGERGYSGDGGDASRARFDSPQFLISDRNGVFYIGDEHNHAIRRMDKDGRISTLIGSPPQQTGTNGATSSESLLNDPEALLFLDDGSLLIADAGNGIVRRLTADGRIQHFAGQER